MRVAGKGLAHGFDGTALLFSGLDFQWESGDLVAIVGPSGSGKSTLLSILAGWVRPVSGDLEFESVNTTGWVFQNPHGVARRTALDHVTLPLLAKGVGRRAAEREAQDIMELFGLGHVADRHFRALSGGEAQRLMLARAVAKSPDLLLVDEPTAQLDPQSTDAVNDVLTALAAREMIVVVATHDPDTADACTSKLDLTGFVPHESR